MKKKKNVYCPKCKDTQTFIKPNGYKLYMCAVCSYSNQEKN